MNTIERKTKLIEKIIWLLTVCLFASFYIFNTKSWISYLLFFITMAIFFLSVLQNNFRIAFKIKPFHLLILGFSFFCLLSSMWAENKGAAIEKAITIFELLVCISLVYIHYQKFGSTQQLIQAVMWAGVAVTLYSFVFYGFDIIRSTISQSQRLDNTFANINSIAMLSALACVITVSQLLYKKKLWTIIFLIPAGILIAASGSRKALILLIGGIFLVFCFRYATRNIIRNLARVFIILALAYLVVRLLSNVPIFSGINKRMEGLFALLTGKGEIDSSALKREYYKQAGIEQFLKTPILGIGIGNSGQITLQFGSDTYLHNNYIELLACGGIIGTLCYYSIYIYILFKLFQYRKGKNETTAICITLIILQLIMDYGVVSYYSKSTYFYFLIFFLQVQEQKKNCEALKSEIKENYFCRQKVYNSI